MDKAGCIGDSKKRSDSPGITDTPSTQYEDSELGTPMNQRESPTEESKKEIRYGQEEGDKDKEDWLQKKDAQFAQRQYNEQAKVEAQIDEMLATKDKIPPPTVMHDKSELHQSDIFLPGVTIIAGNKLLIEDAHVKLNRGRKYGMVGRNGTGKTTLINAICRKELDKMP